MKNNRLVCLLSILMVGCGHSDPSTPEQQCLKCSIDSLAIEHLQKGREGCRYTQLKVFVNLQNICSTSANALISVHRDPCERPTMNSSFHIKADSSKLYFVPNTRDSLIRIGGNTKFFMSLRSGFYLDGWSLESIVQRNDKYINNTGLIYSYNGNELICNKTKEFHTSYYLDDVRVTGPDDSLFYKLPPDPVLVNFDSIMSLD